MSQTAINLDFSENEKETNTMQHEDSAKAVPGSLAELLLRILRHSKCNQDSLRESNAKQVRLPIIDTKCGAGNWRATPMIVLLSR